MGQKINPRGLRIGTVLKWRNNWYSESSNYLSNFYKNLNIKNLIKTFLLLKSEKSLLVDFFIYDINGYKSLLLISFYNLEHKKNSKKKRTENFLTKYKKTLNINNNNTQLLKKKIKLLKLNKKPINKIFVKSFEKYKLLLNLNNKVDNTLNNFYLKKFNKIYLELKNKKTLKFYKGLNTILNMQNNAFNYNFNQKLLKLKNFNNLSIISNNKLIKNIINKNIIKTNVKFLYAFIFKIYYQIFKFTLKFKLKKYLKTLTNLNDFKLLSTLILTYTFLKLKKLNFYNFKNNINLNINFKKHKFLLILIKKLTFNFNQINKFKLNNLIKLRKIKENHLINLTTNELNLDNNNYKDLIIYSKKKNLINFLKFSKLFLKDKQNFNNLQLNSIFINNYLKSNLITKSSIKNKNLNRLNLNTFKYTNLYNFKRVLNILTKLNYKVFLYNIKSLFNFSKLNISTNESLIIQKQKINRYFEISNKLKKRFNRRWNRINFLGTDLMNIAQYSLFFKNPTLLAYFISYQFTFLPKNKRQTSFAKYISKILFNFKGEFSDIKGLKLQFKGRFNKWSRTKKWVAQAGNILLQSYNTCVDYSCSKGLVKKGIFSTRIWIQYDLKSKYILKKNILKYFQYSYIKHKFLKN